MRIALATALLLGCAADPDPAGGDTEAATGPGDGQSDTAAPGTESSDAADNESSSDGGPPQSGELRVLTYNVAGLPAQVSGSDPVRNIPQISPLLNEYGLVLAQEDFFYHAELIADVMHPYMSDPWPADPEAMGLGDGLNRFADAPFTEVERQQWYECNGQLDCSSDCLARKGWSYARHSVADGVEIDVYNLHMEAGGCPEDLVIRLQATLDLANAIAQRSEGRALIVAGDFNLRATDPEDVQPLANIIEGAALTDVCDALSCGDQRIDHIMIRSGDSVTLEPLEWSVPPEFVDARTGDPLSDHLPVAALIGWTG